MPTQKVKTTASIRWYHRPKWAIGVFLGSVLAAYVVASLAIESGSLFQYAVTIAFIALAVNRLAHIILWGVRKRRAA